MKPNCAILAVGTELTSGLSLNTNSAFTAEHLTKMGYECVSLTSVPDDINKIAIAVKWALGGADILIITGGLGPTVDDLTREGLSKALGKDLRFDPQLAKMIEKKFDRICKPMPESALRQANILEGAIPIEPTLGTAPGMIVEVGDKIVFALPGVPREMKKMLKENVVPFLKGKKRSRMIPTRTIKTCGIAEVFLEEKVKDILAKHKDVAVTILAHPEEVHLRLSATGPGAEEKLTTIVGELSTRLGNLIYGFGEDTLESVVGELLLSCGLRMGVAESCTGGLLGNRITNVPGSSRYFLGGIVAYSNEMKQKLLMVPGEILRKQGAVSSEASLAMSNGARRVMDADIGLSITGIAGPTGGTAEKPVGLVFVAISSESKEACKRFVFLDSREMVKFRASQLALNMLRLFLLKELESKGGETPGC